MAAARARTHPGVAAPRHRLRQMPQDFLRHPRVHGRNHDRRSPRRGQAATAAIPAFADGAPKADRAAASARSAFQVNTMLEQAPTKPAAAAANTPSLSAEYVHYGCLFCAPESWLNFDASPTLRFERIPILG